MTEDLSSRAVELYKTTLSVAEIAKELGIGKNRLYDLLAQQEVTKRRQMKRSRTEAMGNPRRHERRDCLHYYQDGGCLDQAAKADKPALPCKGCQFWEYGDNSEHHGDSDLWREVYLMKRGG
jgi:hypothetical protein